MKCRSSVFYTGFAAFFLVSAASAGDENLSKDKASAVVHAHGSPASAQRIFLDPTTGEARTPTREERKKLQEQNLGSGSSSSLESAEPARKVRFADGSVGVYLKKPKNLMQAHVSRDGRVETHCKDESAHKHKVQP